MTLLQFTRTIYLLYKRITYQKKYNQEKMMPLLESMQRHWNQELPAPQLRKMTHYYSLLVPPVLCENYAGITGRKMTEDERYKAVLMGINTPIFDDFFDDKDLTSDDIRHISQHPEDYPVKNISEYVFQQCHAKILETAKHPAACRESLNLIIDAQFESLKQFTPTISEDELVRISFLKGAESLLIYHSVMDDLPTTEMKAMLIQLGGVLQINNDIFDFYKDLKSGITTLPNRSTDFKKFKDYFTGEAIRFNRMALALPYPKKNIQHFIITMQLVISRGLVAIDQFIEMGKKYPLPADINIIPRKEMICDMELWGNRIKWMRYAFSLSNES